MKILNITAQKPFSTGSGIFLNELMNAFEHMGHEQALVCGLASNDELSMLCNKNALAYPIIYNSSDIPYNILGMSDEMPYPSKKYKDLNESEIELFKKAYLNKISTAIDEFNPDVIICHHLYLLTSLTAKNFRDRNVIGICHGTCLRQLNSHDISNDEIIANLKLLDKIYALHEYQKLDIQNTLGESIANKLEVLGTGYNHKIFNIHQNTTKYDSSALNIVYAGKISKKKGLISLIRSLNSIKPSEVNKSHIHLRLAGGNGCYTDLCEIEHEIEKSPHKIEFLGELSQEELALELNKSDLFVLPSFYEGLPLVVVEALACGLPVVTTDTPGLKFWISENIKEAPIKYVKLPRMIDVDTPLYSELDIFEKNLSAAILESALNLNIVKQNKLNLSNFTWINVAKKLISI